MMDFAQVIDMSVGPNNINIKNHRLTEDEFNYQEKVKSYTKFAIGTKFTESTPLFSD